MKIQKIINQHRRDFTAIYECEHCGHEQIGKGYDDADFHANVIPKTPCESCEKTSPSDYRPLTTKFAAGEIV